MIDWNLWNDKVRRLRDNQIVQTIVVLIAIISSYITISNGLEDKHVPNLTYFVHPVRTAIVHGIGSPAFDIVQGKRVLKGDVTSVQVALWNRGRQAIRREDILSPIVLHLRDNDEIIDASIRKCSRAVTGASLDKQQLASGKVSIDWKILEHDDGCVIQLLYAGGIDAELEVLGVIQGQSAVGRVEYYGSIQSGLEQYKVNRNLRWLGSALMWIGSLGIVMMVAFRKKIKLQQQQPRKEWKLLNSIMVLAAAIVLGYAIYFITSPTEPPFGF